MPGNIVGTVLKLLVASLIVGAIMMWLDVDALGLVRWLIDSAVGLGHWLADAVKSIWGSLGEMARWAVTPILVGATVVIPIWLIAFLVGKAKRR
jgi:hypothetical protein